MRIGVDQRQRRQAELVAQAAQEASGGHVRIAFGRDQYARTDEVLHVVVDQFLERAVFLDDQNAAGVRLEAAHLVQIVGNQLACKNPVADMQED